MTKDERRLTNFGLLTASYAFYFCNYLYLAGNRFSGKNILSSAILTATIVSTFYFQQIAGGTLTNTDVE